MKKASPDRPAMQNEAKILKIGKIKPESEKKISTPVLLFALGSITSRKPHYVKPQAVKELEEMADIENAKRHPQFAKYAPKAKYRDDTANGCTRCIIDYIIYKGGQAERINTMGIPIDNRKQVTDITGRTRTIGSVQWRPSGSTVGSADISATINRRSVKIEVKIGKDRQSAAQRQYQAAVEAAGGIYYIAKDFTSFVQWYNQTFGEGGKR